MPQFDVFSFSSQLFWLAIVFGFLYFLISRYIAPKAESIFSQRDSLLEENLNFAEEYNKRVQSIELQRESKLVEVNSYVENLYKQAFELMETDFANQKKALSIVLDKKKEKALLDVQHYIAGFHTNEPASCIKLAAFIIAKITNKNANMELLKEIHGKIK